MKPHTHDVHRTYHVTARTHDHATFPAPLELIWKWSLDELKKSCLLRGLRPHAFVLMGNHFHLLAAIPADAYQTTIHEVLEKLGNRILLFSGTSSGPWENHHCVHAAIAPVQYLRTYRYILQNPLRAGFVSRVEDWPYSSCSRTHDLPLFSPVIWRFGGDKGEINWLNEKLESRSTLVG